MTIMQIGFIDWSHITIKLILKVEISTATNFDYLTLNKMLEYLKSESLIPQFNSDNFNMTFTCLSIIILLFYANVLVACWYVCIISNTNNLRHTLEHIFV